MKTVKEISEVTGISIRTLRYYDEIGLLKPTEFTEAGYRLYDSKALQKLQQIMFFRELEIPLAEIKNIMDNPNFDKEKVLLTQKSLLEKKCNRLKGIIELISDVVKGVNTMSFDEFTETDVKLVVDGMKKGLSDEEFSDFIEKYGGGCVAKYEEQLKNALNDDKTKASMLKWYGSKEKIIEGHKPVPDIDELRGEFDKIHKEFSAHIGCAGDEEEYFLVKRLADSYKQMLNLDNARNFLLDLAKEYLQNGKIAETQDIQYGKGTTRYMAEAIQRYYGV